MWHWRFLNLTRCAALAGVVTLGALSLFVADAQETRAAREVPDSPPPTTQPATTRPAGQSAVEVALAADRIAMREHLVSGLIGSKHDFRNLKKGVRDLCLPCHTPHVVSAEPPLLDQRAPTTQPLRPFQTDGQTLTGWSLLCLGCHDGVTAQDVYSSGHAIDVAGQLGNSRLRTTGLRSHPMGIEYPLNDPDYEPRALVEQAGLLLPDGRIQCTTCHDAHNTYGHPGMLKISNTRSRLCLTCHRR